MLDTYEHSEVIDPLHSKFSNFDANSEKAVISYGKATVLVKIDACGADIHDNGVVSTWRRPFRKLPRDIHPYCIISVTLQGVVNVK